MLVRLVQYLKFRCHFASEVAGDNCQLLTTNDSPVNSLLSFFLIVLHCHCEQRPFDLSLPLPNLYRKIEGTLLAGYTLNWSVETNRALVLRSQRKLFIKF